MSICGRTSEKRLNTKTPVPKHDAAILIAHQGSQPRASYPPPIFHSTTLQPINSPAMESALKEWGNGSPGNEELGSSGNGSSSLGLAALLPHFGPCDCSSVSL